MVGLWKAMGKNLPENQNETSPSNPDLENIHRILRELELPQNRLIKEKLMREIAMAEEIEKDIIRQKYYKKLPFNDQAMRTLRRFTVPSEQTQDILCGFFLLLGEYEGDTRVYFTNIKYRSFLIQPEKIRV